MKPSLVLFDFDGTLCEGDSMLAFIRFDFGWFGMAMRLPAFLLRLARLILTGHWNRAAVKSALVATCWKNAWERSLLASGQAFYEKILQSNLRPGMIALLRKYQADGATVAIVSASLEIWLKPVANDLGVDLICTQLEYRYTNNIANGNLATPNCNYDEKVRRIQEKYDLSKFHPIIAYGNSTGDYAMLCLADEAWFCLHDGTIVPFEQIKQ